MSAPSLLPIVAVPLEPSRHAIWHAPSCLAPSGHAPARLPLQRLATPSRQAPSPRQLGQALASLTPVGGTGISFLTTRTIINRALGEHYAQRRAALAAKAPGGGGPLLHDSTAVGDAEPVPLETRVDPRAQLARDLSNVGRERQRTRWTKGRGLEGEVEEEDELRDTYLRPGVPRNV